MGKPNAAGVFGIVRTMMPVRHGIGLLVGVLFGILSLAPSRASDDGERGCVYRLSVYVKTADAMLQSNHPMILSSARVLRGVEQGPLA